jgi:hypothetical protein
MRNLDILLPGYIYRYWWPAMVNRDRAEEGYDNQDHFLYRAIRHGANLLSYNLRSGDKSLSLFICKG